MAAAVIGTATASHQADSVTIKARDKGTSFVVNKSATDTMYFMPGAATVKSGGTLTFEYAGPKDEPHTLSIVKASSLPRTSAQMNNCTICNTIAGGHIKNPHAPPGPTNDIVHWTVDKGKAGLDEPGDSIAIEGNGHKSISIKVTAPAGTTLNFLCAVHPWMQGTIKVT
jgi:plastocyanin